MPTVRLRASLEVFFAGDGDVYLLRAGSGDEFVIRAPAEADRDLLRRLATGVDVPVDAELHKRVQPLVAAGVVLPAPRLDALRADDAERFVRQLPYLEDFGDPVVLQQRLRSSTVAVVGCGGLGTWAVGALASAGIGRFVLVDHDEVELSNLNRQILYGVADIGRSKVERTAAWLERFDPSIAVEARRARVEGPDDLEDLGDCDVLLLTADWPPYELARWANAASLARGLPFLVCGQQPPLIKVGPFYIPGVTPCQACHEAYLRSVFDRYDELEEQRRAFMPPAVTLGPASAAVGALLAMEVIHLLVGDAPPATAGQVMVMDLRTLETRAEPIARLDGCPACATAHA